MKDEDKTKEQLIEEVVGLRQRAAFNETPLTYIQQLESDLQSERLLMAKLLDVTDGLLQNFVRAVLETENTLVVVFDPLGRVVSFNKTYSQTTGYSLKEGQGKYFWELFVISEEVASAFAVWSQVKAGQYPIDYTNSCLTKQGSKRVITWSFNPIQDPTGSIQYVIGSGVDITEQTLATEALRESEERLRRIVDSNIIGIFFGDLGGNITEANDAFLQMLGYTRQDLLAGKINWHEMTPPEYVKTTEQAVSELREHGVCVPFENEFIRQNGSRVFVMMAAALFEGSTEQGVCYVLDLTERKQAETLIQYQVSHDLLTGLPNRMRFNKQLSQALADADISGNMLAVMFLDLDRFKTINDSLGHDVGDQLLQSFADRVTACLRAGDTLARWGGDEFTVLLPHISSAEDADRIARRILDALKPAFNLEFNSKSGAIPPLHITSSIGIALYPHDGEDAKTLLINADISLYRAKSRGRNNYQVYCSTWTSHRIRQL